MKKILLSFLILSSLGLKAQTTVFEDSFDTYTDFAIANVGSWTLTDVDLKTTYGFTGVTFANSGVAKSFQVFNATTTSPPLTPSATSNWTARTGSKNMVCFASTSAPWNNDFLISPQITLGTTGNVVSFWAKACDGTYPETFKVGISSSTATTGITPLSTGNVTTAANVTYVQYSYNIPASFNSQPVYISINCISVDKFGLAIDDFKVTTTGALKTADFFKSNFTIYPNPANSVINISNPNSLEITSATITDVNGRIVKEVNSSVESMNVSDLNAGVYFLKVSTADGSGTTKFVKQ